MEQKVILIDLGDTIMIEETEHKDAHGVTLHAELIPGVADLLRDLAGSGIRLALVADTRIGTYRNVLKQHSLYDTFAHFAISDELGVAKPHPLMFTSALEAFGARAEHALMIGNNYERDVVGARQVGVSHIWFRWNDRYPGPVTPDPAVVTATSVEQLRVQIEDWLQRSVPVMPFPSPLVAAHRGTTRFAPENTLAAFDYALGRGAQAIELDVQLTCDQQLVVIHDPNLERTTTGHGFVKDHTFAQLRELDAGAWFGDDWIGQKIPTLDEVLALVKGRARLNIELKHGPFFAPTLETQAVAAVRNARMESEVLFMSFDHTAVARVKRLAPEIPALAISGSRLQDPVDYLERLGADGLNQSFAWWTQEDLTAFGRRGLIRHASCINDLRIWNHVRSHMPIDMVDSDNFDFIATNADMNVSGHAL